MDGGAAPKNVLPDLDSEAILPCLRTRIVQLDLQSRLCVDIDDRGRRRTAITVRTHELRVEAMRGSRDDTAHWLTSGGLHEEPGESGTTGRTGCDGNEEVGDSGHHHAVEV